MNYGNIGGNAGRQMMPILTTGRPMSSLDTNSHRELYVGDLSFFCEERHLLELFSTYGFVEKCRVVRSNDKTRSLLFGFVTMSTIDQAIMAVSGLNNYMFMGRILR